jgi:hypothetical protein
LTAKETGKKMKKLSAEVFYQHIILPLKVEFGRKSEQFKKSTRWHAFFVSRRPKQVQKYLKSLNKGSNSASEPS